MIGEVFIFDMDGDTEAGASGSQRHRSTATLDDVVVTYQEETGTTGTRDVELDSFVDTADSFYIDDLIIG